MVHSVFGPLLCEHFVARRHEATASLPLRASSSKRIRRRIRKWPYSGKLLGALPIGREKGRHALANLSQHVQSVLWVGAASGRAADLPSFLRRKTSRSHRGRRPHWADVRVRQLPAAWPARAHGAARACRRYELVLHPLRDEALIYPNLSSPSAIANFGLGDSPHGCGQCRRSAGCAAKGDLDSE
jgi:hypothetical protein